MYDFTRILPPEITTSIFSHLDPRDHVQCVCVCHDWYNCVPDHVSHSSQLHVSPNSWRRVSTAMMQCLGAHIRHVDIYKANTITVLRALAERKCAISCLEIKAHARPVKGDILQLFGDSVELITAMKPFANTLTELTITDHPSDIPIPHLLSTLPSLTHLTLRFDFKRFARVARMDLSYTAKLADSPLLYLHLDNAYNFEYRVVPVLRRCPSLRALVLGTQFPKMTGGYGFAVNFDTVFELCPRLRYLMWSQDKYCDAEDECRSTTWQKLVKHTEHGLAHGALRDLTFYGDELDLVGWIVPMLRKSQHSLQYLNITSRDQEWWSPLEHVLLHQLKTLRLSCRKANGHEWINALIAHCSAVQDLSLSFMLNEMDLLFVAISAMHALQRLRLCNSYMSYDDDDNPSISRNLGLLQQNNQLARVQLYGISVSNQGLLDLCGIPCLHELCLCMSRRDSRLITVDGFLQFADKLLLVGSRLHTLSFEHCHNVTDEVLEQLAHVESLLVFEITHNHQITDGGLRSFVDSGHSKRKISVSGCSSVSRTGIWERS